MAVLPSRFHKQDRVHDERFGAGTVIAHEVISEIVSVKFDEGVQCYYERDSQEALELLEVVEQRRLALSRPRSRASALAERAA